MGISRRDFVKAGAGAFFVASSERLFGADAPSSRVRFAIAGCREGGRGYTVLDNALKVPGVGECRLVEWTADGVRFSLSNTDGAADDELRAVFAKIQ